MAIQDSSDVSPVEYLRALKRSNQPSASPSISLNSTPQGSAGHAGNERRRSPRLACMGSVEFRAEGSDIRTWASVTDVSRTGCYVEMQATSPPDTPVDMVLDVSGVRFHTRGKVRVTYPFLGMGIAFTEMSLADQAQLEEMLQRLGSTSSGILTTSPKVVEPRPISQIVTITDPAAALNSVVQFFEKNGRLTREEFLEILLASQKKSPGL
jgi:hypothetical protein